MQNSKRYAACVEYDGSAFNGWQTQKHDVRTTQSEVESALSKVANHLVSIVTAGRTDALVHASHQIIHFDSDANRTATEWLRGSNRFLPKDVRILWVKEVDEDFHARFSALSRSYRFIIYNHKVNSAIFRNQASHVHRELDVKRMQTAANFLLGEHDFSAFRASGCQAKSPIRELTSITLHSTGNWIWFDVTANAFLQHMVRNIAGCLIEVGCGKQEPNWLKAVLESRDRTEGGVTARPNGLYLIGVCYPSHFSLPTELRSISFWG